VSKHVFKTEKRRPFFKIQNDINRLNENISKFQVFSKNVKSETKNLKISVSNYLVQRLIF